VVSTFQGGIVSRGTGVKTTNVPLQAEHQGRQSRRASDPQIALWDGDAQKLLVTFDRDAAGRCSMRANPIFWSSNATTAANSR
jgi:hypothetical protein